MNDLDFLLKIQEQLLLVSISVCLATLLGVPLGIIAYRHQRLKTIIVGMSSILWTVPSLALLAFMIPLFGIGVTTAICALTLYTILPIVRNTLMGLEQISDSSIEAARGLGFSQSQKLILVELPLALPTIIQGVRIAAVIAMGIATLAAFVGAGGLGDFINRGLATNNTQLILWGAIPAAVLALTCDYAFASCEKLFAYRERGQKKSIVVWIGVVIAISILTIPISVQIKSKWLSSDNNTSITIASKNFTEQFILAELMSQMIEHHTELKVNRKFNLGSTAICHQAMLKGDIDIYPEYTGTALHLVLKQPYENSAPDALFQQVANAYIRDFEIVWLNPFGFNNSQALIITDALVKEKQLTTVSELALIARSLNIGAPAEFLSRADSMPLLQRIYDIEFARVTSLDPGLMYSALANDHVDVIMGFSTDGRIQRYGLTILEDNKIAFPSYYAAPLIRQAVLNQYPEIKSALAPLLGIITEEKIQKLNAEVDIDNASVAMVARQFLQTKQLI